MRKITNKKKKCIFPAKNHRGDITTEQIVLIIILIVSFAVILFFLFRLNLGKTTEQQNCHNSVVTRGSGVVPKESIPLNCKTQYACLTKDGTCKTMPNAQIQKVKTATDVYQFLAEQMADCWWMFGEGKLNYLGEDFGAHLYCSICSQVSFDKSVQNIEEFKNGEIDENQFYNYLSATKLPGKDTSYLDYMIGVKSSGAITEALASNSKNFGKIYLNKDYYVMTGMFNEVGVLTWIAGGVAVGTGIALAAITGGASIPATVAILGGIGVGGTAGYFVGTTVKGASGHDYLSPTIVEATPTLLNDLKCEQIKSLA
ncbi:Uncharacterised protein [uncultured archaeon]|nr:Uncharacterised protein [uncultured archaeon]